jgi:GPH family glycoside/pentoside/hexuronide:cation symporter
MSASTLTETAPQDRVALFQKVIYGLGSLANNLLAGALGCMVIVLTLGLGMDPGKVGLILGLSKLTDAFLDPIMGYVSDHTRSRWGRRRPFIFAGAIVSGIFFALMWQLPAGHSQKFYFWFFLLGTNLFYVAYTLYAAPFIGLGYEMTADYNERTRIQAYGNVIGQIAWLVNPWMWAIMSNKRFFHDSVQGARGLAIGVGVTVAFLGMLPGLFCKEPFYKIAQAEDKLNLDASKEFMKGLMGHVAAFFKGFVTTLKNARFIKLAAATFLVFNGFMMISGIGSYVIIYYVLGGDQSAGGNYIGFFGSLSSLCTFCVIPLVAWFATKVGKKKAFIVSTMIAIVGYAAKWPCYNPGMPNLLLWPAPLIAFGLGGLFTTVAAMIADVCDQDELENGHRREATYGAIYWWMVKLGMALAVMVCGYLINFSGFRVELGDHQSPSTLVLLRVFEIGIPILAYLIAILAVATYDLDQDKAQEIRVLLEKRRGKASA